MSDSVTLEWEPAPMIEPRHRLRSYVVERFAEEPPPPRWERLAALPITITRYTVPGLSPGRRYKFRVFAETQEGLAGSPYEYEPPLYSPHVGGTCSLIHEYCKLAMVVVIHSKARSYEQLKGRVSFGKC